MVVLPLAVVFGTGGARVSLLTEVLTVGGVAMDLVGAGVLAHAHNAESIAEIRAETGAAKRSLGEDDAIATHAQLLAEKRIGWPRLHRYMDQGGRRQGPPAGPRGREERRRGRSARALILSDESTVCPI